MIVVAGMMVARGVAKMTERLVNGVGLCCVMVAMTPETFGRYLGKVSVTTLQEEAIKKPHST